MMITTLISAGGARAQIEHHGAHVLSWTPVNGAEQLFLSKTSSFAPGAAIRGGVPVVFPQFSNRGPLPKHGFARNKEWHLRPTDRTDQVVFELRDSADSRAIWPFEFLAELMITVADNSLMMALAIHNTGSTAFEFTTALHTYFRVAEIADTCILGLKNCLYQDLISGANDCVETSGSLAIQGIVDRVYKDAPSQLTIQQVSQNLVMERQGFPDTVIWNPWQELGATLADLEADGYRHMLCVESAAINAPVKLQPGASWRAQQNFHVT